MEYIVMLAIVSCLQGGSNATHKPMIQLFMVNLASSWQKWKLGKGMCHNRQRHHNSGLGWFGGVNDSGLDRLEIVAGADRTAALP
jgi:hypothetical protein